MSFVKKLFLISFVVLAAAQSHAQVVWAPKTPTAENLLKPTSIQNLSVRDRAVHFANVFLINKTPYVADPLGEGPEGTISTQPLYRFDGFDCTTFVETVMGLSFSRTPLEFMARMMQIRYKDGNVDYVSRNHFTSIDWIPNNVAKGLVKDITLEVALVDTKWSFTWIDKAGWYAKKGDRFKDLGARMVPQLAKLAYVSKEDILNKPEILARIPSGSIFSLVRPNWDLTNVAGTHMDVSHQGFLIRENGVLYMVHASNGMGRDGSDNYMGVKKEALTSYISRVMMSRTSMAGFNILALPKNSLPDNVK